MCGAVGGGGKGGKRVGGSMGLVRVDAAPHRRFPKYRAGHFLGEFICRCQQPAASCYQRGSKAPTKGCA